MGISAPAARAPRAVHSLLPRAFRPIAFGATSRGTVSITSACRAGTSNTVRQPLAKASATTCQTATLSLAATRLSVSMIGMADRLTPTSSRLRCARSARVPAARPKSRLGSMRAASTRPTANGPASTASQAVAVSCIPAPVEAASVDDHNQRNGPERNDLNPDAASNRVTLSAVVHQYSCAIPSCAEEPPTPSLAQRRRQAEKRAETPGLGVQGLHLGRVQRCVQLYLYEQRVSGDRAPPRAHDLRVERQHALSLVDRLEQRPADTGGGESAPCLAVADHVLVEHVQQVRLSSLGRAHLGRRRGEPVRDAIDNLRIQTWSSQIDALPDVGQAQARPPVEVPGARRSMAAEVAHSQLHQGLSVVHVRRWGYALVEQRIRVLLALARAATQQALQFGAHQNVTQAAGLGDDAGLREAARELRTGQMPTALERADERLKRSLEHRRVKSLAPLAMGAHGEHARTGQLQHPADVGRPYEVPRRPQHVRAHDRAGIEGVLQIRLGRVAGPLGDGPLRRTVVLRLDRAQPANHFVRGRAGTTNQALVVHAPASDVAAVQSAFVTAAGLRVRVVSRPTHTAKVATCRRISTATCSIGIPGKPPPGKPPGGGPPAGGPPAPGGGPEGPPKLRKGPMRRMPQPAVAPPMARAISGTTLTSSARTARRRYQKVGRGTTAATMANTTTAPMAPCSVNDTSGVCS